MRLVKFKKIRDNEFKYREYSNLSDEEKEIYRNRKSYKMINNFFSYDDRRINIFESFPYHAETERLKDTEYDCIVPFGLFSADFLIEESKNEARDIEQLLSHYLGSSNASFSNNEYDLTSENISNISKIFKIQDEALRRGQEIHKEDSLFTLFLLNDFFNQDDIDNYGDFIELKGDEIYDEKYMKFDLSKNEYTNTICEKINFTIHSKYSSYFCFSVSQKTPKKILDLFKTIKKDELKNILEKSDKYSLLTSFSGRAKFVENILDITRSESRVKDVKVSDISKLISKIYVETMSNFDGEYSIWKMKNIMQWIESADDLVTDSPSIATKNKILSYKVYDIFKTIRENQDKIGFVNFIAFVKAITQVKGTITKNGDADSIVEMLNKQLEKSVENFLNIINIFAETTLEYEDSLPTLSNWNKAFKSNEMNFDAPAVLVIPLIVSDHEDNRKIAPTVKAFRYDIKVFLDD